MSEQFRTFLEVLCSPSDAIRQGDLLRAPWLPLGLNIAAYCLIAVIHLSAPKTGITVPQALADANSVEHNVTFMATAAAISICLPVLFALFLYLPINIVCLRRLRFVDYFAIYMWCLVPSQVGLLIDALAALAKGSANPFGDSLLANSLPHRFQHGTLFAIMSSISLFQLWSISILFIAVVRFTRCRWQWVAFWVGFPEVIFMFFRASRAA